MNLALLDTVLAVCRLDPADGVPSWFSHSPPLAATVVRAGELTLVCPEDAVPDDVVAAPGWRALEVSGPMDLSMTGVTAALSAALAEAGVTLFAISSFDTDNLLVRDDQCGRAIESLRAAGHTVAA